MGDPEETAEERRLRERAEQLAARAERRRLSERVAALERVHGLTDPMLSEAFSSGLETVARAMPTSGPQRLAMIVPDDHAEINLGQAFAGRAQLDDAGISGRTDTHIDFRTTAEGSATTVTLGGPATRAETTWDGTNLPRAIEGYGMGTQGAAYRHADKRMYVLSNNGDVVIRAASDNAAVFQSTGSTEVNAGRELSIIAPSSVEMNASQYTPESPVWNAAWQKQGNAAVLGTTAQIAGSMAAIAASALSTASQFQTAYQVPNRGAPGTAPMPVRAAKFAAGAAAAASLASLAWLAPGAVRASAEKEVAINGGRNASLWGLVSANVIGGLAAGLAGSTADVKGFARAAVWGGLEAGLAALSKVVVKSDLGNVDSYSGGETVLSSNDATTLVAGEIAQMSSDDRIAVHGTQYAHILCDNYGLVAGPAGVRIAWIGSTRKDMHSPAMSDDRYLKVVSDGVEAKIGGTQMHVRKTDVFVDANGVNISIAKEGVKSNAPFHKLGA